MARQKCTFKWQDKKRFNGKTKVVNGKTKVYAFKCWQDKSVRLNGKAKVTFR